jgi:two-component system sensor histidine kinase KdpD
MSRGWLRIYLGAAPGVGKTYAMLSEGNRRRQRGTDVVVGFVETHGRPHTAEQLGDLEVIPRREVVYRGTHFEEMDVPAILLRHPEVVLVDELAHTNAPGVENDKRWRDVETFLNAGINVISTVNLQHLESVNDVVENITGIVQRETVPDSVVRAAEQIELVDMTPEALRRRLAHGNVYPADRIDAALTHFFRPGNLAALRELALLWLADRVDDDLAEYRQRHGIAGPWETKERVVVAVTGAPADVRLIRRAARIAARSRGELVGITVRSDDGLRSGDEGAIAAQIELLEELGGRYVEVVGHDFATTLVASARVENATQLVIGASESSWFRHLIGGTVVERCVRAARGLFDVHVIGIDEDHPQVAPRGRRQLSPLPMRRLLGAGVLGAAAFPLATLLLLLGSTPASLALALSAYLLVVIAVAALGGLIPGVVAAIVAFSLSNWEFTPPIHTFTIASVRDILALVAYLVAAITVSSLVDFAARRSHEALRAQRDARALARIASHVTQGDRALEGMVTDLVRIFELDGAELKSAIGDTWTTVRAGTLDGTLRELPLDGEHLLVVSGRHLDPASTELLRAVSTQLVVALDRKRLEQESEERAVLKRADVLRSALLAAVSHDLRTPLASIKTAATALLSPSATFTPGQSNELLHAIDTQADRLDALVENLLDMTRIQEGSVELAISSIDVVELVDRAAADVTDAVVQPRGAVHRTGLDHLSVTTDPALLERVLENLIVNALIHGGGGPVTVDVGRLEDLAAVRIVDRGPGIPPAARASVFLPFQRRDDVGGQRGLGLGLAIAKGFVDTLGGELRIEDTPGGGCTMVATIAIDGRASASTEALGS